MYVDPVLYILNKCMNRGGTQILYLKVERLQSQYTPLRVKYLNSEVIQVKVQKYYPQNVLEV